MRDRLKAIADASFGDMEGADMPDFAISERLSVECDRAALRLTLCIDQCNQLAR